MIKQILSVIFLGALLSSSLFSQSKGWENDLKSRFDTDSLLWMTHYEGEWADFHDISMTLGFDGKEYHGWIEYKSSNTRFDLFGEDDATQTILFEIDNVGRQSGIIQGNVTDTRISGVWWNSELSHQVNIQLLNSSAIPIQKFKPTIAQYISNDGQKTTLLLHKEAPAQVNGFLHNRTSSYYFSLSGECQNTPCTKWTADLFDEIGLGGKISGLSERNNILEIECTEIDSLSKNFKFSPIDVLPVKINAFTNYLGSIDISTIELPSKVFNDFIQSKTSNWWAEAMINLEKGTTSEEWTVQDRQKLVYNGWMDIGYLDPTLITGMLVLTGGGQSISYPYAFDREKEMFIEGDDIFQNSVNIKNTMADWVVQKRPNLITEQALNYDQWVLKTKFDQAFFRSDGWVIVSEFDPIFGTAEIVIPYDALKTQLKKKSLISSIYR